jgi:hypothetical protein
MIGATLANLARGGDRGNRYTGSKPVTTGLLGAAPSPLPKRRA